LPRPVVKSPWDRRIYDPRCTACPRLARHLANCRREHPDYFAHPVGPFGAARPKLLVVGLAPGMHGANATGRPFTGDWAGLLLYRTLHEFGFATRPVSVAPDDGLRLKGCRITNAVKCLPPANRPTGSEVRTCNRYLEAELATLSADLVILALGRIAHDAVLRGHGIPVRAHAFRHGAVHRLAGARRLVDSYHCSRYNVQTGRLTEAMFRQVFRRAARLAEAR
jgi:uracil-DNA glycosylase family 4